MTSHQISEKHTCSVCGSNTLEPVMDLPNFPITGVFVTESDPGPVKGFDQGLNLCRDCGHAQLRRMLPPPDLYGDGYAHRSSASHLTPTSFRFIVDYLERLRPGHRFRSVLEVGCNDLMLLNQLAPRAARVTGIDPLWIGATPPAESVADNMTVVGSYIEDVDLAALPEAPDLVISTHNLEHIGEPREQVRRLLDAAAGDALFVIEVPDFDAMVRNLRFDQVFHQHVHYFSLASFLRLIAEAGGHYLAHVYNPRNWGGTVTLAFTRQPAGVAAPPAAKPSLDRVRDRYALFRRQLGDFRSLVEGVEGDIWAYGAAQMLPTLAYHMDSDLTFLKGILDDCKFRPGLTYPHIPVRIRRPEEINDNLEDATVIITALDAVRPIMNRLRDFNPKYVLVPTQVF